MKFLTHILLGLLIIIGGLYIFVMGYKGVTFVKNSGEEYFFLNLGIAILVELVLVFGLFSLLKLIGYNKIVYRILGGVIIGVSTFLITEIALWFVPIGQSVSNLAGLLGLIYGAVLLPIYIKPNNKLK